MDRRPLTADRDDASRPQLFAPEEWRQIIALTGLTNRQAEVAGYIVQSKKDKQIASALKISKRTVRSHISDIMHRLDAIDRVGIAYRLFAFSRQLS